MRTDRMRGDAERLDPESRALLELSVVRGIPDEDLAGMLGMAPDGVRQRRERVLRELGADSEEERETLAAELRAAARPEAEQDTETDLDPEPAEVEVEAGVVPDSEADVEPDVEPEIVPDSEGDVEPDVEPEVEPEPEPEPEPEVEVVPESESEVVPEPEPPLAPLESEPAAATSQRARRRLIALTGGAAVAAVVAVVLALGGGEDADSPPPPQPDPAGAGAPKTGRLEPLGGGDAGGSARISGPEDRRVLRLTVRGLPPVADGGYVVWLYDSVSDTRALTGSRKGAFTLREPLPSGAERYRFLDVSYEPADANPNHSGASVLRVPLAQISGR